MIQIRSPNTHELSCVLPRVISASLTDRLSGERILTFSTLVSKSTSIAPGMIDELDGQ